MNAIETIILLIDDDLIANFYNQKVILKIQPTAKVISFEGAKMALDYLNKLNNGDDGKPVFTFKGDIPSGGINTILDPVIGDLYQDTNDELLAWTGLEWVNLTSLTFKMPTIQDVTDQGFDLTTPIVYTGEISSNNHFTTKGFTDQNYLTSDFRTLPTV